MPAGEDAPPLARSVAREAAHWLMCLHSGQATEAQRQAWARWRSADPAHELAWQRAERLGEKLNRLPPAAGLQVLDRPQRQPGRRAVIGRLALLLAAVPTGHLAWRSWEAWGPAWTASHQTATGERRSIVLADGTRVQLNTATALDVVFSAGPQGERLLVLHRGELLIETGADPDQPALHHRPFVVQTRHGRIRALGTRFLVRQLAADGSSQVAVQRSAVEIQPARAASQALIVQAGHQASFDDAGLHATEDADPHAAAWSRGLLLASNQRLADFIAELGRYRPGRLHCAPEVAELRISGAFQLDNTDAVLAALPHTLPVRVVHRTRWWVGITAPPHR